MQQVSDENSPERLTDCFCGIEMKILDLKVIKKIFHPPIYCTYI